MSLYILNLEKLEDTAKLANELSKEIAGKVVLLMGTLGSGKTTFTRYLVNCLPGGDKAEVASPSFTLCNVYPTCPEVLHYDLYRLPPGSSDESLEEALDSMDSSIKNKQGEINKVILIEWAEHLPSYLIPPDRLEIYWHHTLPHGRKVILKGEGSSAFMNIFQKCSIN